MATKDLVTRELFEPVVADVESLKTDNETNKTELATLKSDSAQTKSDLAEKADKTSLAKTDRSLDMLWKLNKGITYTIEDVTEEGTNEPPTGAMYETVEEVYGKSEQDGTNGYQLLNGNEEFFSDASFASKSKVITYENHVLTFILSGSSAYLNKVLTAGTYTFSFAGDSTGFYALYICDTSGTRLSLVTVQGKNSIVLSSDVDFILRFVTGTSITAPMVWTNIMLESGSTAHDYEPYTGGLPSPSPDYPQEITDITEENFVITDADGNETTYQMTYTLRSVRDVHDVLSGDGITRKIAIADNSAFQFKGAYGDYSRVIIEKPKIPYYHTKNGQTTPTTMSNYLTAFVDTSVGGNGECTRGTHVSVYSATSDNVIYCVFPISTVSSLADFKTWLSEHSDFEVRYQRETYGVDEITTADADFLASLDSLTTDHTITITDQNGNDISYLVEYITKCSEVTS